jgi:hypothetical protein
MHTVKIIANGRQKYSICYMEEKGDFLKGNIQNWFAVFINDLSKPLIFPFDIQFQIKRILIRDSIFGENN